MGNLSSFYHNNVRMIYSFLVITCIILISSCTRNKKLESTTSSIDTLPEFPNTLEGQTLKKHIYTISGVGKDAEMKYQSSLSKLKEDTNVNKLIYEIYKNVSEEKYMLRMLLIETLKELKFNTSLNMLNEIAVSKIPDEKSKDTEYSTKEEEIIIRLCAIEGLTSLAMNQNIKAQQLLFKLIDVDDMTLKQIAIRGYLKSLKADTLVSSEQINENIELIKKKVPNELHWMVTYKETDIKSVPYPKYLDTLSFKSGKLKNKSIPKF